MKISTEKARRWKSIMAYISAGIVTFTAMGTLYLSVKSGQDSIANESNARHETYVKTQQRVDTTLSFHDDELKWQRQQIEDLMLRKCAQ